MECSYSGKSIQGYGTIERVTVEIVDISYHCKTEIIIRAVVFGVDRCGCKWKKALLCDDNWVILIGGCIPDILLMEISDRSRGYRWITIRARSLRCFPTCGRIISAFSPVKYGDCMRGSSMTLEMGPCMVVLEDSESESEYEGKETIEDLEITYRSDNDGVHIVATLMAMVLALIWIKLMGLDK